MRRVAAVLAAIALTASLAGSSLAATSPTKNTFVGDFDLVSEVDGSVVGHITARLDPPTAQRFVPGTYEFRGAPGNPMLASLAQIGAVQFWFDAGNPAPGLGGSNVAFAEGVACDYFGPNDAGCHVWAVMFIDDIDPALPDQVAFAAARDNDTGEWDFAYWYFVGRGEFVLRFYGDYWGT